MSKKLFRMTEQRKRLINRMCSTINTRREAYGTAEQYGVTGSLRHVGRYLYKDKEELLEYYIKCDHEEKRWSLVFDVLWITGFHNDITLINAHCNGGMKRFRKDNEEMSEEQYKRFNSKDERGWYKEWDIPLSVYNKAIDDAIELFEEIEKETKVSQKREIALLREMRDHRNGERKSGEDTGRWEEAYQL